MLFYHVMHITLSISPLPLALFLPSHYPMDGFMTSLFLCVELVLVTALAGFVSQPDTS